MPEKMCYDIFNLALKAVKGGIPVKLDFHTHAFPDALAPRAMAVLSENGGAFGYTPHTDGTLQGAKALLRAAGIDGAAVLNIATNPRQEKKVNDFAIATAAAEDFFYALGSLHPDSVDPAGELDRLRAAGIRGIKLHPDYAGVEITDPRYDKIFSLLDERGMFAVTHAGPDPVSPGRVFAPPEGILTVLRRHPTLTLVAAHLGGPGTAKEVLRLLVGTSVYFDTSLSSTRDAEREDLYAILRRHDPRRLLFGTDTPWTDPATEIRFLENSGLPKADLDLIFYRNARRLLGADGEGETT